MNELLHKNKKIVKNISILIFVILSSLSIPTIYYFFFLKKINVVPSSTKKNKNFENDNFDFYPFSPYNHSDVGNSTRDRACDLHYIAFDTISFKEYFNAKEDKLNTLRRFNLNIRSECAFESTGVVFPNAKACLHHYGFTEMSLNTIKSIAPNIKLYEMDFKDLFDGSIVDGFFKHSKETFMAESDTIKYHYRNIDFHDILRVAILEKFDGGLYMDTDIVLINTIQYFPYIEKDVIFLERTNTKTPISGFPEADNPKYMYLSPNNGVFYMRSPVVSSDLFKFIKKKYSEILEYEISHSEISEKYFFNSLGRYGMGVWRDYFFQFYDPKKKVYFQKSDDVVMFLEPPNGIIFDYWETKKNLGIKGSDKIFHMTHSLPKSSVLHLWNMPSYNHIAWRNEQRNRGNLFETLCKRSCPKTWKKYWKSILNIEQF